jgi:nitrogen fixation/metabolism regulation signal transduction histidine kinase
VTATTVYYTLASVAFEPTNFQNLDRAMTQADMAIFLRLCVAGLILIGASMALTIYYMHRLVGPLYRFEQILKAAASGNIPPEIKLRKNDEFKSLAAALLEALHSAEKPPEPTTEGQPQDLAAPSPVLESAVSG